MLPLDKSLRNLFERKIKEAREIAEEASESSLNQLGIGVANPYSHLTNAERELRRRLRAHGRQLGDKRNTQNQTQEIEGLLEEVAYQHWHRMLFARFLAENHLLMYPYPDEPVPITLEECEDLSVEEGAKNGWEVAARYAERMLPQIFRSDSPIFEVEFPPEYQQRLEQLLIALPSKVFTASDSLGWVYQFWQAKKKENINESEVKIGAKELPAVTQLFTDPYMVNFLLDNSIGAWWAEKMLEGTGFSNVETEEELREKLSSPSLPLEFLRFFKDEHGNWVPKSGISDEFRSDLSQFKLLDPCCGSGHFLVAALLMLVPIRMNTEGLTTREAVDAVLRDNLHGLDIDQRVVEIAAFSLALTAWRYPDAGGYRNLPIMNVACSGLIINAKKSEWLELANYDKNISFALEQLYNKFSNAPILGSLINPLADFEEDSLLNPEWLEIGPLLNNVLRVETNDDKTEMGVVAQGLSIAAQLLCLKYDMVVTNIPYLGIRKQNVILRDFCEENYFIGRHDLATVFLLRSIKFLKEKGILQVVIPNNWMFLGSYSELRATLLDGKAIKLIANLGTNSFETITGEVVNTALFTFLNSDPTNNNVLTLDVTDAKNPTEKASMLRSVKPKTINQHSFSQNPDKRFILDDILKYPLLENYANSFAGIQNGDSPRFLREFWEVDEFKGKWWPIHLAVNKPVLNGGMHTIIDYDIERGHLRETAEVRREKLHDSDQRGKIAWNKKGIFVSRMGKLPTTIYYGNLFDQNGAVIMPRKEDDLLPILSYCLSSDFSDSVRKIDKKVNVTNSTLTKVPFDIDKWKKISDDKFNGALPKLYSDDPTQWIFHGHPVNSLHPLHVSILKLLGYSWPAERDLNMELSQEASEWVKKSCELVSKIGVDNDGIVCIPSVLGEAPAADRLLNILAVAFKDEWNSDKLSQLLSEVEHSGNNLDTWIREKSFAQHCKIFKNRPFIWQVWDGLMDGFSVLINYHKLDKKLLERLIYTYLGDWIKKQKGDLASDIDGAQEKLDSAENLKKRLELILEGEAPYDIFARWKHKEEQPIGWEPDINDGVRINIRPFISVPDIGKKGAGILRDKPKIKWNKDRGKDVESAPWYDTFGGDRINDYHLLLSDKMEARRIRKEDS